MRSSPAGYTLCVPASDILSLEVVSIIQDGSPLLKKTGEEEE